MTSTDPQDDALGVIGDDNADGGSRPGPAIGSASDHTDRLANLGVWDWDVSSGRIQVNAQYYRMLGYEPNGFVLDFDQWLARTHPEDRDTLRACLLAGCRSDEVFGLQYRFKTRSGAWLWLLARGVVLERAADGRALRVRGIHNDIAHQRRAAASLRDSERNYREVFNAVEEGLLIQDPLSLRILDVNDSAARMYGYQSVQEILERSFDELIANEPPYDEAAAREWLGKALTGEPQQFEWLARRKSGDCFWVEVSLKRTKIGGSRRILAVVRDIDEQRANQERLRLAARILESTTEGVMLTGNDLRIQSVNRAFTRITGYAKEEVIGQTPRILHSGRHDAEFYRAMWATLVATGHWRGELWNRRKNGEIYPELLAISRVQDARGKLTHYVGVFSDISDLKRVQENLDYLANHDPLTHLPNRQRFLARLEHSLQRARRDRRHLAVLMLDLQRFKHINESMGHVFGDAVLVGVADTLSTRVRASDTLARLGGDEFVVVLEDLSEPQDAIKVARKLIATFEKPLSIEGHRIFLGACVGISVFPRDGDSADTLLRQAGVALDQAEKLGVNQMASYSPGMQVRIVERFALVSEMKEALARGEFRLDYQAQVGLADQRLIGVEALLRWDSPKLGAVEPDRFIPAAEDIGLIRELGTWVAQRACSQIVEWDRVGFHVPRIAINLSLQELARGTFPEDFQHVIGETGIDPSRIELEVTESVLLGPLAETIDALMALRNMGVGLAIDDFGTGHSSLVYLKRLPVKRLKIDRNFVRDLGRDLNDEAITRAVIGLGRSLGLAVLAEGVETREQAVFLSREGCQEAQGFFFGRPMGAAELAARWSQARRNHLKKI
ncbi:EAL domain-containing protein [Thioalkalicoccus limnaeus]|uniref:EAL domain-containing protein n=1 Tax=Thioalkalicoccus limnaeus TaxID=120681 RepID=A0ABV4BCR3_9GAMM